MNAPTQIEPLPTVLTAPDLGEAQAKYIGEQRFVQIATADSAFAGFYIEDGGLIGLSTSDERRDDVADAIIARLEPVEGELPLPELREMRVVQRSFVELARYRNLIEGRLSNIPDVAWLDLDEVRNLVDLTVTSEEGLRAAQDEADALGIPSEAISIQVGAPNRLTADLDDRIRPLVGGLQTASEIVADDDGYEHTCTLGFNAFYEGEVVFFTNSHCTREIYKDDSNPSSFYQYGWFGYPNLEIGSEYSDPAGWDCSWYSDDPCRYSDAAAILTSEDSVTMGEIARTQSRDTDGDRGSTIIDTQDSTFVVFGTVSYPGVGQEVNMMGQNGGWQYGDITKSCTNFHLRPPGNDLTGADNDFWVVCGYEAEYHSWPGDSGGPVFTISPQGNGIYLVGLNFGNVGNFLGSSNDDGIFSSFGGMEQDFGSIAVTPGAMEPNATISGPTTAAMWTYCEFEAEVTGGSPPYSYQWSGLASGTGSTISFTVTQGGTLYLDVTDSASETDGASHQLTIDAESESCPL